MKAIMVALLGILSGVGGESLPVWFGTGADGIYAAELEVVTGALSPARKVVEAGRPSFLALRPGGGFLYAVARDRKEGKVLAYRITEEGGLALLSSQPSGGNGPCHLDVTADGQVVLVANYGSGSASSYLVGKDGGLAPAASVHQHEGESVHPKRQKGPHAHGFFAGPGGRKGYAPDLGIDQVVIYAIAAETGVTTRAGAWAMPPGTGPRHLKFGRDGKQIYVLGELNLTVVVGDLDGQGMPTQSQVIGVLPEGREGSEMTCSEIRVHPNGRFVYVAVRDLRGDGRDCLSVFEVLAGGKLKRVQTIPAECHIPRNFALDPSGRWLLVAGQTSNEVPVFKVAAEGTLEFTGRKIAVPQAMCVVFGK